MWRIERALMGARRLSGSRKRSIAAPLLQAHTAAGAVLMLKRALTAARAPHRAAAR